MSALNHLGTDIDSSWSFNDKGDINTITEGSNIGQAILNRLKADLNTYNMFYVNYGSNLQEHFGEFNHKTIHEYIRIEIEDACKRDPRIQNIECDVNKIDKETINCTLKISVFNSNTVLEYNLVLTNDASIYLNKNTMGE